MRNAGRVRDAVAGCHGIVHLTAVSRIVWGERDPETCREVDVGGLGNVIAAAAVRVEPFGAALDRLRQPSRGPFDPGAPECQAAVP